MHQPLTVPMFSHPSPNPAPSRHMSSGGSGRGRPRIKSIRKSVAEQQDLLEQAAQFQQYFDDMVEVCAPMPFGVALMGC